MTCSFAANGRSCAADACDSCCGQEFTAAQVAREALADIENAATMRRWLADHAEPQPCGS